MSARLVEFQSSGLDEKKIFDQTLLRKMSGRLRSNMKKCNYEIAQTLRNDHLET